MDKRTNTDPTAVTLTGQPLRQGGPQRLDEVLRDLDLRPTTKSGCVDIDPETAAAIQVLRDAGLEPEIIGTTYEEPSLSMTGPTLSGAAMQRVIDFAARVSDPGTTPFDHLKTDRTLVTGVDYGPTTNSMTSRLAGSVPRFVVEDE
jgi:hypothetical protein